MTTWLRNDLTKRPRNYLTTRLNDDVTTQLSDFFFRMAIAFAEIAPASHHVMVHQKLNDLALISTFAAIKPPRGTGLLTKVKSSELGFGEFGSPYQFGRSDGPH